MSERAYLPTFRVALKPAFWWLALEAGGNVPGIGAFGYGSDSVGDYLGTFELRYRGVGGEGGVGQQVGPIALCATAHASFYETSRLELDKDYQDFATGIIYAHDREQLDHPDCSDWAPRFEASADYLFGHTGAIGSALFVTRTPSIGFTCDVAPHAEVGLLLGGGAVWGPLRLGARYEAPFLTGDGSPDRDPWFSGSVGWIF